MNKYRVFEDDVVDKILKIAESLDSCWYVDRSKFFQNISADGKQNKYLSAFEGSVPKELHDLISSNISFPYDQYVLNKYSKGMSIGKHRDVIGHEFTTIVFLDDKHTVLSIYDDKDNRTFIKDEKGMAVDVDGSIWHSVDPVEQVRYSLIILR